jgi:hypothetical protein
VLFSHWLGSLSADRRRVVFDGGHAVERCVGFGGGGRVGDDKPFEVGEVHLACRRCVKDVSGVHEHGPPTSRRPQWYWHSSTNGCYHAGACDRSRLSLHPRGCGMATQAALRRETPGRPAGARPPNAPNDDVGTTAAK